MAKPKLKDPDTLERQLQRDLEIIRQYREVSARYGGEAPTIAIAPPSVTLPHRKARPKKRGNHGLIGTATKLLSNDWEPFPAFLKRVQSERPKTTRAPLRNAVTRLVEQGVAEKQGTKKTGVAYRRKPKEA
jgi:hypothetical protein